MRILSIATDMLPANLFTAVAQGVEIVHRVLRGQPVDDVCMIWEKEKDDLNEEKLNSRGDGTCQSRSSGDSTPRKL